MDWQQTPEEIDHHYGEGGPVAAAAAWGRAVNEGDFAACWRRTHPDYRLQVAEAWVTANAKHPALAGADTPALPAELAADMQLASPLALGFAATTLEEFRGAISAVTGTWGWASRPRPIGPDQELVLLVESDSHEPTVFSEETKVHACGFLMQLQKSEWLLARINPQDLMAQS